MLPALVMAALLVVLTAQNMLAVSFSISGTPFTVTATELDGRGFEQSECSTRRCSRCCPAKLHHLCQSVTLGGLTLRITAGQHPGQRDRPGPGDDPPATESDPAWEAPPEPDQREPGHQRRRHHDAVSARSRRPGSRSTPESGWT